MTALLLALVLALPNPVLTPGALAMKDGRPWTAAELCAITWHLDVRHVSATTKRKVFEAYHIPLAQRHLYVIDHRINRSLAGADRPENLWPQPIAQAHLKDRLEVLLEKAVCAKTNPMPLAEAQAQILRWGEL